MFTKIVWSVAAAAAIATAGAAPAAAQDYPSKEVRWIIPWNAGGSNDITLVSAKHCPLSCEYSVLYGTDAAFRQDEAASRTDTLSHRQTHRAVVARMLG